ncbi:DUF302 domain-containing protein [Carboxylicivirga linearis]|uniref:DUF302 domain-containing protein n=1 Tax=Carboxylicivirga linearis TaxID=1628157 RepID=A0ABS5K1R7_9BACT|nr:DUF302 domain-containing protein [Carboxylicivirga linearis]MBS2101130.1 DUF302 domain-containing protein [Carboxylicivirga linearis]
MKRLITLVVILSAITVSNINGQKMDKYYFSKTLNLPFEEASDKIKAALAEQQFGIVTEVDMHKKFIEKGIDANAKPYRLLGACNPKLAYDTVLAEENIGLFLPCKVLVKYIDENTTEIVMIDPTVVMGTLGNPELIPAAEKVTKSFKAALDKI